MSHTLNSLKGVIRDYIGEYFWEYKGVILGVESTAPLWGLIQIPYNTGSYIWVPIIVRGPIYISPILGTVI